MKVELDKHGLVCLVLGCNPTYTKAVFDYRIKKAGKHIGGHVDRWEWEGYNYIYDNFSEMDLLNMYYVCKNPELTVIENNYNSLKT